MIEIGGMTLYDVPDLEKLLGLHAKTVRALLRSKKLPGKKLAKKWYVTEEALTSYFRDAQDRQSTKA